MKKGFIAFLFVCACALGFSYGYRGTYWGETFQELQLKTRIIKTKEYQDYTFLSENARMLGQPTSIHYAFRNMRLMSIVYSVNDTEESVEMLNNILDTKKLRLRKRYKAEWDIEKIKEATAEQKKQIKSPIGIINYSFLEEVFSHLKGGKTLFNDIFLKKPEKADSNSEMIIADYDADTEVYIFRNILDNYITFVYTQKQSEF